MGERKLTKAQRAFLELAERSPDGNPWRFISMSQRGGGAKMRMFDDMRALGWFDDGNRITDAGRSALEASK